MLLLLHSLRQLILALPVIKLLTVTATFCAASEVTLLLAVVSANAVTADAGSIETIILPASSKLMSRLNFNLIQILSFFFVTTSIPVVCLLTNAPNKKAPPAPIKRRSRCGKCNWLPFYRPYSFASRVFTRFAEHIRDIT